MLLEVRGWLVVRTHSQREAWACENIANQGGTFYYPRIAVRKKARAKAVAEKKVSSLFPGYIFVKNEGRWRFLLGTFGVLTVVLQGGLPAIMPDAEIERLHLLEGSDGFVNLPKYNGEDSRFRVGETVRVVNGHLTGFVGIYDGTGPKDRERVLLDYLGRKATILIGGNDLEAASAA